MFHAGISQENSEKRSKRFFLMQVKNYSKKKTGSTKKHMNFFLGLWSNWTANFSTICSAVVDKPNKETGLKK